MGDCFAEHCFIVTVRESIDQCGEILFVYIAVPRSAAQWEITVEHRSDQSLSETSSDIGQIRI